LGKCGLSAARDNHEGIDFGGNWILSFFGGGSRVLGWGSKVLGWTEDCSGGSLELVNVFESCVRARARGTSEDLREEEDPLTEDEADERDLDDLEVLEVWRGLKMRGRIGREDSLVLGVEEVQAGVSGGSAAGLLLLWSILRSQKRTKRALSAERGVCIDLRVTLTS